MKKVLTIITTLSLSAFIFADEFVEEATTLGGYGEMHWDMEANDGDGKLDFHRFIFYIKHQFNSEWSMMSEIEIEHNMVYSDGDGGYLAMEQAHLNYWNGDWGFKGGVLLVPAGITNEYHEPPTFMSVERPEYNKYIIPTTWFDNGFAFYGTHGDFNWNYTMVGDLNGDDIGEGIRSARAKGVYSTAASWTKTVQGSWTGMDGLKVGGSVTMNDAPATHVNSTDWDADVDNGDGTFGAYWENCGATMDQACNNEITRESVGFNLTEFNATYSKNNMYARLESGTISYTDNLHQVLVDPDEEEDSGDEYYEAELREIKSSSGHYLDLGYNIADLLKCDGDLFVWTRTSSYNKDDDRAAKDISLFGVTYKPANNISFKFETGESGGSDVMRMGLGYMF